jgi:lipopolysaccharide/colanic/teichoic acid biosynthesis glycosyltransferase
MGAISTSAAAVAGAALFISSAQLLGGTALLPRAVVLGSALVLVPAYSFFTLVDGRARERGTGADRVLAVLSSDETGAFERDIRVAPEHRAHLVGTLSAEQVRDGVRSVPAHTLGQAVDEHRVTVLVLGRDAVVDEAVVAQAAELHGRGVRIRTLTMFYDQWLGKLPVGELERISLLFDIQELHTVRYARIKRTVDLVVGLVGVLLLTGLLPAVWVLDRFGNPGPLLFRQTRVGKGGKPFTILKFRTMTASDDDQVWTTPDDPRLGSVGRWLRRMHLDEVPQAVNLLRGELSIVGPRPEQPRYVDELTQKIPFYDVRHLVNPGVTGWAQVKFPYGASVEDALEKLQYEFWYLRHQGPLLDARILARTLRSVLHLEGR